MIALVASALLAAAAVAAPPAAHGTPAPPIRRFALIAGVNDGGPDRVRLHYARSDAERVARLLERLGGVAAADEILLLDPDDAALRQAFRDMEARVRGVRAANRAELILYYSGHSDEQGLLLRGRRVPFADVRRFLESVGAEVRIAIVDSCSSGALTREKGGQRAPPFLVDTSSAVKGHAILTSSAADEASQESDRVRASFFTHYLLTGLRGAADASQDGKITVSEAYQYAFSETLARTERTRSGAQHPAYDIQLVGSGDVVLTDLRGTDATLVFPEAATGRFFVRDAEDRLVAELRKPAGRPVELGVDAGSYRIVREEGERLTETVVTLARGAHSQIPLDRLTPVPRELTAARGGELAYVPVDLAIWPPVSLNHDGPTWNRVQLGLFASRTTRLRGFGFAMGLWADEDVNGVQLAPIGALARGEVTGLQLTGIAGAAGAVHGAQIAGVLNLVRGDATGLLFSGTANWMGGRAVGGQVGGVVNRTGGDVVGGQLAGVVNWTEGHVRGAQLSGVVNFARSVSGAQLGTVNVARDVQGVQLSVVNVATGASVRGWQIGLVNVSRHVDGIPLGLVNVVRDGWHRILAISDEDGSPALGWAGGNGFFHTTLELVFRRTAGGSEGWARFGPGLHLWRGRLGLDLDLMASRRFEADFDLLTHEGPYVLTTLRGLVSYRISRTLALVAGPTGNVMFGSPGTAPRVGGALGDATPFGDHARMWAGFQAGVRL